MIIKKFNPQHLNNVAGGVDVYEKDGNVIIKFKGKDDNTAYANFMRAHYKPNDTVNIWGTPYENGTTWGQYADNHDGCDVEHELWNASPEHFNAFRDYCIENGYEFNDLR